MGAKKFATILELWRTVRPFLPADVQDTRVEKITVKFKLNPRGGTEAEAHTSVILNVEPNMRRTAKRKDKIMDPYSLYRALEAKIENFPQIAQKMDITMDIHKGVKITATIMPTLREEQTNDGNERA